MFIVYYSCNELVIVAKSLKKCNDLKHFTINLFDDTLIVEMEQSGCLAVAKFRNFDYAALIYGGDDYESEEWSNRDWRSRNGIRYDLVGLCKSLVQII